jgi:hypothetical protein
MSKKIVPGCLLLLFLALSFTGVFVGIFVPSITPVYATSNSNWLSGWSYRCNYTIGAASGAGTNYPIQIRTISGNQSSWELEKSCPTFFDGGGSGVLTFYDGIQRVCVCLGFPTNTYLYGYNPINGLWSQYALAPNAVWDCGSAVVNNRLYIIGGSTDSNALTELWIYNPATNSWSIGANCMYGRAKMGCAVYNNNIYVFGSSWQSIHSHTEVYFPSNNTWKTLADEPFRILACARVAIGNYIYCMANDTHIYAYSPSTDIYYSLGLSPVTAPNLEMPVIGTKFYCIDADKTCWEAATNGTSAITWTRECDMIYPTIYPSCVTYNNTLIYAIGGRDVSGNRFNYNQQLLFGLEKNWVRLNNHAKSDFSDVRFTASDGITQLSYWTESVVNGDANFWVKIPDNLNSTGTTIYMYYGNPSATSSSSGTATFPFFDDFLGTSLNTSKWTTYGTGNISVANSLVSFSCTSTTGIESRTSFPSNYAFRAELVGFRDDLLYSLDTFGIINRTLPDMAMQYATTMTSPYYWGWDTVTEDTSSINDTIIPYPSYVAYRYGSENKFYEFEIRRTSNSIGFTVGDSGQALHSAHLPTDKLPMDFHAAVSNVTNALVTKGYIMQVDWALARKYVYPEPVGTWGSEQTSIVSVSIAPSSKTLDIGRSVAFTSTVSGGSSPYSYQWYQNNTAISGATTSTYVFSPSTVGLYNIFLNATDNAGIKGQSNIAVITVNSAPSVTISPTSVTLDVNQTQIFSSTVNGGTSPYDYQWFKNGTAVPGGAGAGLTYTFSSSTAGSFLINVTVTDNVVVRITSNTATVTVHSGLAVSISPSSVTMDVGQLQTFTSSVSGGTSPYSYQWYLDGIAQGTTGATWICTPSSGSHMVYVEVTDGVGAQASSGTATITVHGALSVTILPTSVITGVNQSQLFTSTVSGGTSSYSYQWYLNGTSVPGATSVTWTFPPSPEGTYFVYLKVTDGVGANATSNTVTVIRALHYVAATNVTPSKTVLGQGFSDSINVTVANQGNYTGTFKVTVFANATSIASQNITLSIGNSSTTTFIWNTTGFARGRYTIKVQVALPPGETNTANNTYTGGWVEVRLLGDVNGDGYVTLADVGKLDLIFSEVYPYTCPPYDVNNPATYYYLTNPATGKVEHLMPDVNGDGKVSLADVGKLDLIYSGYA